jgi:hypothetical protein
VRVAFAHSVWMDFQRAFAVGCTNFLFGRFDLEPEQVVRIDFFFKAWCHGRVRKSELIAESAGRTADHTVSCRALDFTLDLAVRVHLSTRAISRFA